MKVERNSRGRATIPKDPEMSQFTPYEPDFPALPVTPSIDLKHDGRCDNPVARREKATDPYVNSTGSLTLLLQLEWKADLHISTQDEA